MANFVSRYANHILVIEPADFETGRAGRRIEFINGKYSTEDKKEIEFLRKHRDFGVFIFEENTPKEAAPQEK